MHTFGARRSARELIHSSLEHHRTKTLVRTIACLAVLALPCGAVAAPSDLSKFLSKVDSALSVANGVLSGASATAGAPATRSSSPDILPQPVAAPTATPGPADRVEFAVPPSSEQVAMFNEALPVINKTLGILSCATHSMSDLSVSERAFAALRPYTVENSVASRPG
jgi:hypothetical protein